jgi:membrane dipeptidase
MSKEQESTLYDYGLNKEQERRAQRLHKESIIINMLALGLVGPQAFTDDMTKQIKDDFEMHHDFWERTFGFSNALIVQKAVRGEFPAAKEWWDISGVTANSAELRPMANIWRDLSLWTLLFDHSDWLIKVKSTGDIHRAKAEGKHAAFLHVQCTDMIGTNIDMLDILADFGFKVIQLTYNSLCAVGAGCTERTDAGVSHFGVQVIQRMNKLGIIVDTGHCGHQTTLDACAISKDPVIASHTLARGVINHDRSKSDDALLAIAKTGGVIGICIVPFFLTKSADEVATIEHFLDHIDYTVKLVGYEHVGIGTDWPFMLPEWGMEISAKFVGPLIGFRPEHRYCDVTTTQGYNDCRDFINMTRGLVARGYNDEQIKAILGGNWLRVMDAVWK